MCSFPTVDAMCKNLRSTFIGPAEMPNYLKRLELAELNRRIPAGPAKPIVKIEDGGDGDKTMVPYVSTPLKTYDIKEEPMTPTNDDAVLWAIADDVENAYELANAIAAIKSDDAREKLVNFLITCDDDVVNLLPSPQVKRVSGGVKRALTW